MFEDLMIPALKYLGGLGPFGLLGIYYRAAFTSPKRYLALYQPVAKTLLTISLVSCGAALGMLYMQFVLVGIAYDKYSELADNVIPKMRGHMTDVLVPLTVFGISMLAFLVAMYLVEHANRELRESEDAKNLKEAMAQLEKLRPMMDKLEKYEKEGEHQRVPKETGSNENK